MEHPPKVVAIVGYPPNRMFGGGIILENLFRNYSPGYVKFVTNKEIKEWVESQPGGVPQPRHEVVPINLFLNFKNKYRFTFSIKYIINFIWTCVQVVRIVRHEPRDAVLLAVPWGWGYGSATFASAYIAHRMTGRPLIVYELDEWRASLSHFPLLASRLLERVFHARMLKSASDVWVISDPLADLFRERFGISSRILPSCVDLAKYRAVAGKEGDRSRFRLVYTGEVSVYQAEAIRNVLRSIQALPGDRFSLAIYSSQSPEQLASHGISGANLEINRFVPIEDIPGVLTGASALLLPFSFGETERAVVSTSLPTKTADYLASGVPILVHAPPYATIARLAQNEGWAEVVDEPIEERITSALQRLDSDCETRRRLATRALEVARVRHDLESRRAEFIESLSRAARRHAALS